MTAQTTPPAGRIPALNWPDAHRCVIQLRYSDLDAMGHVNNARYAEYLEVSRIALSQELGLGDVDDLSVLARLELDYLAEIRLEHELVIETLIERVGRTSWVTVSRFLADGRPCALARGVQVSVDEAHQPRELPQDFAARVAPVRVDSFRAIGGNAVGERPTDPNSEPVRP
ncbi:acyl-CoA thioesterase [Deinococcus koreensis]|uniref:Acyl-CoA thioesterase n=1 Tax=Deinococcus koreensis TaxID=2054903 RepID=A0A2K3UX85_9DEIO|nr:thioesterase family protein [Deinococcus koreensis]PNY81152.1 acyl-CoA thioesterase [Deinococcus koreensis]